MWAGGGWREKGGVPAPSLSPLSPTPTLAPVPSPSLPGCGFAAPASPPHPSSLWAGGSEASNKGPFLWPSSHPIGSELVFLAASKISEAWEENPLICGSLAPDKIQCWQGVGRGRSGGGGRRRPWGRRSSKDGGYPRQGGAGTNLCWLGGYGAGGRYRGVIWGAGPGREAGMVIRWVWSPCLPFPGRGDLRHVASHRLSAVKGVPNWPRGGQWAVPGRVGSGAADVAAGASGVKAPRRQGQGLGPGAPGGWNAEAEAAPAAGGLWRSGSWSWGLWVGQ